MPPVKKRKRCPTCKGQRLIGGGALPKVVCSNCGGTGLGRAKDIYRRFRIKKHPKGCQCIVCVPRVLPPVETGLTPLTRALQVPEILEEMARTFRERNRQYGDNWKMVGQVMAVLFPNGVHLTTAESYDVWHLFELKIVKLTRFAIGRLAHIDSIHDDAVYSAMIEAILKERSKNAN